MGQVQHTSQMLKSVGNPDKEFPCMCESVVIYYIGHIVGDLSGTHNVCVSNNDAIMWLFSNCNSLITTFALVDITQFKSGPLHLKL